MNLPFSWRHIFSWMYVDRAKSSDVIVVAGTGRSGTTWLAQVMSRLLNHRLMFEPLDPRRVGLVKNMKYKRYLRPDASTPFHRRVFRKILEGRVHEHWVNAANTVFWARGRIVKTIRGNLLLKWFRERFRRVPIVFITRHPCAVVNSRLRVGWKGGLDGFMSQQALVEDHLKEYVDIISNASSDLEKTACLWCIENLVPLRTMEPDDWVFTTYEWLYSEGWRELHRILREAGVEEEGEGFDMHDTIAPTTREDSAVLTGRNPLTEWKHQLSEDEIARVLEIVDAFGLSSLYGPDVMPRIGRSTTTSEILD